LSFISNPRRNKHIKTSWLIALAQFY